jgi:hypothetical protein
MKRLIYIFTTFIVVNAVKTIFVVALDVQFFFTLACILVVETRSSASKWISDNQTVLVFTKIQN